MGRKPMLWRAALGLLLLGGGALVGAWVLGAGASWEPAGARASAGSRPVAEADAVEALRRTVGRLEMELELAHARREEIAAELRRLEARVAQAETAAADGAPEAPAEAQASRAPAAAGPSGDGRLDEATLVQAGFDPRDVEALRARFDAVRLESLYLRDQAAREGWLGTPRFRQERRAIAAALSETREEFGDELYDWAMYTTGRPNRVVVSGLIEGSAAAQAGLEPGDVIMSYAESRIFQVRDLHARTRTGTAGATTAVDLLRAGEPVRVYMPRGPLGVTVKPVRKEPPPAG